MPNPARVAPARVDLAQAYRRCRDISAAHGRTYHLATRLLGAHQRPAVHALYAFARVVDDIVDIAALPEPGARPGGAGNDGEAQSHAGAASPRPGAVELLDLIDAQVRAALGEPSGPPRDAARDAEVAQALPEAWPAALAALTDTVRRFDIAPEHFRTFLDSMRMDVPGSPLFRDRYADLAELREYMRGSAAAIGLQLLPVLGTVGPRAEAEPAAAALGEAFQLTNFLRDVAEDLDRGRIYLPAEDLEAFGVTEDLLAHCRATGHTDVRVQRALAHLIAVDRDYYRRAEPGIDLLTPRVRPAIRTASVLYAGILERIEDSGYAVFRERAVVPRRRKLAVAAGQLVRAALPGR
ncbi:phytoene/squalene synthase family protein [Nocardia higoensis]|uniref:phytoene/squalene synthase family protein n=1 Tax=Nocardia higoensis TaxID=228599 RepID=UPI000688902C|nr:phytoene/squalene synthase family protein [Nocardia higoensis]